MNDYFSSTKSKHEIAGSKVMCVLENCLSKTFVPIYISTNIGR